MARQNVRESCNLRRWVLYSYANVRLYPPFMCFAAQRIRRRCVRIYVLGVRFFGHLHADELAVVVFEIIEAPFI